MFDAASLLFAGAIVAWGKPKAAAPRRRAKKAPGAKRAKRKRARRALNIPTAPTRRIV